MSRFRYFPVSYDVGGRAVLVVGEGEQALQKLRLLVRSRADLTLFADAPTPELAHFAASNGLRVVTGEPCHCRISGSALVFVATGEEERDAAIAARVRACGVPVNVVDRPHLSDFAVPAIVDRAPLSIAIATDGHAPVLAVKLRGMIEALLAPNLGRVVDLAARVRAAVLDRWHDAAARRRVWTEVLDGRAAQLALAGDLDRAEAAARDVLDGAAPEAGPGKVWLVGAGPGAEDLLTLRAQRLLLAADVIVHDALVPAAVVAMGRRDARRIAVGKRKGHHSVPQEDIDALLVSLAGAGQRVVRLKAGDPLVFGRAGEEMAALSAAGLPFEIVPGITAALAAAADAAIPLSLRGLASHIVFATGHGADGTEPEGWEALAATGATLAIYMGKTVADRLVRRLTAAGLDGATPVAAVEDAGRTTRRLFAGTVAELPCLAARADVSGPVLILVGPAVARGVLATAEPFAAPLARAA